jgi:tetratricopeptide (TPR) repeat protein
MPDSPSMFNAQDLLEKRAQLDQLHAAGRYIEARECAKEILADHPKFVDVLVTAGVCADTLQLFDEAVKYFEDALNLRPTDD